MVGSIRAVQAEERAAKQAEIWANIEVGKHYTGVVKSMTSYGVFVDIGGVDGMVHISELSWSRIKNPAEVCKVGDTLDVYVISYDPEKRKISLGCKDNSVEMCIRDRISSIMANAVLEGKQGEQMEDAAKTTPPSNFQAPAGRGGRPLPILEI